LLLISCFSSRKITAAPAIASPVKSRKKQGQPRARLRLLEARRGLAVVIAAFGLAGFALPLAAQTIITNIPLASGSEKVMLAGPANPRAILIMFVGSYGMVDFDANGVTGYEAVNFLVRTQTLWLGQGFSVAIPGSPNGRTLMGHRQDPDYVDAIARTIDFVRSRATAPVWLIGTSMGSIGAASGAAHLPSRIAGVVLTSSVTTSSKNSSETVFDSGIGAIAVPALVVANRGDTCPSSSPSLAPKILAALTGTPRKELIVVESSAIQGDRCEGLSPHGYLGIEGDVVQRIAGWIGR
jgi:hypothetical protein